ncbi:MAG: PQQ-dependent sugar dehydrogenase [Phycisphaerales bacterium]
MKLVPLCAAMALSCAPSFAQTQVGTQRIAAGLTQPLLVTHAPGDAPGRVFVCERTGRIKIIEGTTTLATPFLDLSSVVATSWLEWGLLGLAFHPDYPNNGIFYVSYNAGTGADSYIARVQRSANNSNVANGASRTVLLKIVQPNQNHRGGWLAFGPDGYLYATFGDGGGQNDPNQRAQNTSLLQGKVLRLDVNGPDGVPGTADDDGFPTNADKLYHIPATNPFVGTPGRAEEIWAYGLRNPWRCSFDRQTGDLWIGDVGQNTREEIDFEPAGFAGGRNYGWRCTEGTFCTGLTGCTCNGPTLTPPIFEYSHTVGLSITGGYVYRGCAMPDIRGTYFYGEYQNSKFFSLRYNGVAVSNQQEITTQLRANGSGTLDTPASFGEDSAGEIYIADYSVEVWKIIPRNTPPASLTITQQPVPATTCLRGGATFTAAGTSIAGPVTYRWSRNAEPLTDGPGIAGSATSQLVLTNCLAAAEGSYQCQISNDCTSDTTTRVRLAVCVGDYDCSGGIDGDDVIAFFGAWDAAEAPADVDGSGSVDGDDVIAFFARWDAGC